MTATMKQDVHFSVWPRWVCAPCSVGTKKRRGIVLGPFFKVSRNSPDCQSELRVSAKVGDSPRSNGGEGPCSSDRSGIDKGRPRDRLLSDVFGVASPAKGNRVSNKSIETATSGVNDEVGPLTVSRCCLHQEYEAS